MTSLHVHSKSGKCGNKQKKIEPITNIFNYCTLFRSKGTFNRYVTLKGGRGVNPFCYGALLEGEGSSSDTVM